MNGRSIIISLHVILRALPPHTMLNPSHRRPEQLHTSTIHEFGLSRLKIALIIVGLAAVTFSSGRIVFGYSELVAYRPEWGYFISSVCMPIGVCGIGLMLCTLIAAPQTLVTINAQGIKDVRVSPDVIPWTRIQSIETRKIDRVWQILLRVNNASQLAFSPTYKGFRGDFDPASDTRTINISPAMLNVDRLVLEDILRVYQRALGLGQSKMVVRERNEYGA